jgi:phosphoglycolate phosphatase
MAVAIFDLDGTLIDSRADIADAGNHARRALGLPELDAKEIGAYVGDGALRLIERLTPAATPDERQRAYAAFMSYYRDHCCDQTRPYDGIVDLLERLRAAGWSLAVATNKPLAFSESILHACGLSGFFAAVRGGDGPRKPDPGQLVSIFSQLSAAPERSWMIGDHHTDIKAGQAAGCRTLFCTWGFGIRGGLESDAEVDRPARVGDVLLTAP